jgi:RNA-directed DNA polymerase
MPEASQARPRRRRGEHGVGAPNVTARHDPGDPEVVVMLMEAVVAQENMARAYARVMQNKGAAGTDRMDVGMLKPYLQGHWQGIKDSLLKGTYRPHPVRKVEIPKPGGGGMRMLGIPTVVDRLIQQALHQVMAPDFDRDFSSSSFGFRERRSAHQAILQAKRYVTEGKRWVVDLDLEKFFDRVSHDILMARVARKVKDKRILLLIRRYLQAGIMEGGVVEARTEGTRPRRPLIAPALKHSAGRSGQGTGTARTLVLPLCR